VKKLLIPDCIENSGLVYEENRRMMLRLTCHVVTTGVMRFSDQFEHKNMKGVH
jgi:hypothetical protein